MGLDTIPTRADGNVTDQQWFNVIKSVLTGDFVPRGTSGAPLNAGGSLGSATYEWLQSFIRTLYFGLSAQGCSLSVDGSGDIIVKRNNIEVGKFDAGGFIGTGIKDATITFAKLAALNQQISSSCGAFSTTSTGSWVDITNLSISVTTDGRPVLLFLQPADNTQDNKQIFSSVFSNIRLMRDAVELDRFFVATHQQPGNVTYIDHPSSGTYTYKAQGKLQAAGTLSVYYHSLVGFRL